MKKISFALVAFVLVFSLANVTRAQEEVSSQSESPATPPPVQSANGLQKILSPDLIKNFKNIKKIGTSLFGIPANQNNQNSQKPKVGQPKPGNQNGGANQNGQKPSKSNNAPVASNSSLEKIPNPGEIKNFQKIQKIGTSLFGIRRADAPRPPVYVSAEALTCVSSAIDKKDLANKNSITARSEKVLAAIDTRSSCQKSALSNATAAEQGDANRVCINTFQQTMKEIEEVFAQAKNDSQTTYITDLKSCSALQTTSATTTTADEATGTVTTSASEIIIDDGEAPVAPSTEPAISEE